MNIKHRLIFPLAVALLTPAAADTIYSGLLDTPIPLNYDGTTLTIGSGTINPFFGGTGVANNNLLQPARDGINNGDTILNFSVGSVISGGLNFATGFGGSENHLGNTFTAGQEGYLGIQLNGANYGWIRVVFTNNESGAVIRDWAYDSSGLNMVVGRIHQSAAVNNAQTVTLSPAIGESFTLGSQVVDSGGNTNNVLKTGAGTTVLTQANTYSGGTTINDGTLRVENTTGSATGTGTVNVIAGTLAGTGTIAGRVMVEEGAYLSPGSAPGGITIEDGLTLRGTYVWELGALSTANAGVDFDQIRVTGGSVDVTGASLGLNLGENAPTQDEVFWQTSQTWAGIIQQTGEGSLSGLFAMIDNSAWAGIGTFSTTYTGNDVNLLWTPIPEPGTALIVSLMLSTCLFIRMRIRH